MTESRAPTSNPLRNRNKSGLTIKFAANDFREAHGDLAERQISSHRMQTVSHFASV
jgi:hypothetical protein